MLGRVVEVGRVLSARIHPAVANGYAPQRYMQVRFEYLVRYTCPSQSYSDTTKKRRWDAPK